jgi:TPR repeat protein
MRQIIGALAALACVWVPVGSADAAGQSTRSLAEEYSTAEDAFRDGRVDVGVQALERAADQGSLHAMLRLGNIYREGTLVPKNELKACKLYIEAADGNAGLDKFYAAAHLVAEAFRRAGMCYAKGLPAPGWEKNVGLAADLFHQAGVMLDDPIALYELGKLYLTGDGQMQNAALAARLLESAARKRYPPAQALLGSLMWEGKLIKQRPASGLALLILGKEAASADDRAWIARAYDEALLTASADLERDALVLVDKWRSVYGNPAGDTIQTSAPPISSDIPTPTRGRSKDSEGLSAGTLAGTDKQKFGGQATGVNANLPAGPPPSAP